MSTKILWDGTPLLPPIDCEVLIEHGRDDFDHIAIVTGYEVKPSLRGSKADHRVFIHFVYKHDRAVTNCRLLCDIKPLTQARSIAQPDKVQS